ncbi:hypothetical protein [Pontibacillus litoralis]|uniref:Lipoprotein n=1 Tax=Pontibacillus litoralis JSM 072002 TaxID=1385512 RepID=A0A0A5HTJ1_9BACI|nr:hypothetical protein [Pontibacillus litoralis]KGX86937.1 hypothetical protein N784_03115 [Pontibacillus litoralis JSM 072002]
MKKMGVLFFVTFLLFGCSNEVKVKEENVTERPPLEEQITNIMTENTLPNKEIIDYDIKGDFIYVIFKNNYDGTSHYPDLIILKENNGKLQWHAGPNDRTKSISIEIGHALLFARDEGPTVTIIMPDDSPNVKGVKVLGETSKAVTYLEEFTDDISKQYTYWIAYTEEVPTHEDFDIIMQ